MEQTSTPKQCPCCKAKIEEGFFKSNELISSRFVPLIREYTDLQFDGFCQKCGSIPLQEAKQKRKSELEKLNSEVQTLTKSVLVASINSPKGWDYEVLGLATGQSVTGTGVFSEFASSFTDLFGAQSGSYNSKISAGEQLCLAQLCMKCIKAGGNAIIGADIDYAEVGGDKGMLMVCMTGTIVKVLNGAVLGEERAANIGKIEGKLERKEYLLKLIPPEQPIIDGGYV